MVKLVVSYFLLGNEKFGIMGAPIGTSFGYGISLIISYVFVVISLRFDIVRVGVVLKIIINSVFATLLARGAFVMACAHLFLLPSLIISMLFLAVVYLLLSILVKSIPENKGDFLANSTK